MLNSDNNNFDGRPQPAAHRMHLSTDALPASERLWRWRQFCHEQFNLGFETVREAPVRASCDRLLLPQCAINRLTTGLGSYYMTGVGTSTPEFLRVFRVERGRMLLLQRNRNVVMEEGQAVTMTVPDAFRVTALESDTLCTCVTVPKEKVSAVVKNLDDALLRPMPPAASANEIANIYGGSLLSMPTEALEDYTGMIMRQITEIVIRGFDTPINKVPTTYLRNLTRLRKEAIYADILEHLSETDLNGEQVAARVGITPRRLRDLVAEDGMTFVVRVRYLRVQRAADLLVSPAKTDRTILEIAQEVGFADLSYFYWAFRQQFAMTPVQYRRRGVKLQ